MYPLTEKEYNKGQKLLSRIELFIDYQQENNIERQCVVNCSAVKRYAVGMLKINPARIRLRVGIVTSDNEPLNHTIPVRHSWIIFD